MKQRYTVAIPYKEPTYGSKSYVARIEVTAVSEDEATEKAMAEFRQLEELSSVHWAREVDEDDIRIESILPAGRPALRVGVDVRDGVTVVALDGIVDEGSSADLDAKLQAISERGCDKVVLDCAELDYISSSGIGAIVSAAARGTVRMCRVRDSVWDVLDMIGIGSIIEQYDSVEQALAAFE